ncbi:MAG: undecaprenyl-diphosphate phosphatase [Clostridiales bacterium]|nr:undecaprenyl-diphosphate phosphatase [Clostridiales bacterium]
MKIWHAIVLGIIQGLSEFLPVSSSGHLVLFQKIFNVDLGGIDMFFDIMLHVGTLFAVCAVFYKDIINLFKKPYKNLVYLIIATIPAAAVGVLFDDWIEQTFFGGAYLALGFLFTALILLVTEIYAKRKSKQLPLSFKVAIPMGLAQAVAILPGISRSGATIAAGTFAGGSTQSVSKFSFLLSIPIILGGFAVSLFKGVFSGEFSQVFAQANADFGWCIALGVIVSAISGFFAIKIMLKAIKKANYKWFSLYLLILGVICIILQISGRF